ncbi:MAG: TolC family protein, partial [Azonexus sp.]|nr:TolC family protein [Azonexus sp.]
VEAATAADDSAIESYNETVIHALQQVADQLLLLQSGAAQSEKAKEAVRAAEEAHRLAEAGYRAGLENYQQVLEAQAALLQQQEFAARAQAEWQDAHAGLMRALGGGVKPAPGPATEAPP